jgi:hypothetical protein
MSHFLDRLLFFKQPKESFSDGHGVKTLRIANGKMPTVIAGHTTKWCALRMA